MDSLPPSSESCFQPFAFPTQPCGSPALILGLSLPTFHTTQETVLGFSSENLHLEPPSLLIATPKRPSRSLSSKESGSKEMWNTVQVHFFMPLKILSMDLTAQTKKSSASAWYDGPLGIETADAADPAAGAVPPIP